MKKLKYLFVVFVAFLAMPFMVFADDTEATPTPTPAETEETPSKVNVYLFRGEGCPHCEEMLEFFDSIEEEFGQYYTMNTYEVWYNQDNANLMEEVAEKLTHTFSNAKETVQRSPYFNYFIETVKRPTSSIGSNSTSHGWIQLVVFAAMTALSVYAAVKSTIRLGFNEMGITSYFGVELNIPNAIRNELISRMFVASLVVYLTFIVSVFVLLKVTARSKRSFNLLVTEIGGFFTPNIILLFVAFILASLFASPVSMGIAFFLIALSFLLCFMSYNFYLYSRASVEGLDKLYVLLISNLFVLLLLFLLVYIQIEPVITLIDQISNYGGGYGW